MNNPDPQQLSPYQQSYDYDKAGNIEKIQHQGQHSYSISMQIDPTSNHSIQQSDSGVTLTQSFDANGNLLYLQPQQFKPMTWNARNQLQKTVLLSRENTLDDTESYLYNGQGQRLQKQHTWQAKTQYHTDRVRYLPALEIHEKWQENQDGSQRKMKEQLWITSLNAGTFSVRRLYWETGKPETIENGQRRYSISNHLGSSQLELDKNAEIISYEEYYPYGGSAIWAGRDRAEAHYKTIRYSGKERDHSGLYYYGARYYAPWLGRWISPDPNGAQDGLNLFRMVQNNPIAFVDPQGTTGKRFSRMRNFMHRINPSSSQAQSETQSLLGAAEPSAGASTSTRPPAHAIYDNKTGTYIDLTQTTAKEILNYITTDRAAYPRAKASDTKSSATQNLFFQPLAEEAKQDISLYLKKPGRYRSTGVEKNAEAALGKIKPFEHIVTMTGSTVEVGTWNNKIKVGDIVSTGENITLAFYSLRGASQQLEFLTRMQDNNTLFIIDAISARSMSEFQSKNFISNLIPSHRSFIVEAIVEGEGAPADPSMGRYNSSLTYVSLSEIEGPSHQLVQDKEGNRYLQSLGKNIFHGYYDHFNA